jgi:hypothetical protein
MKRHSFFDNPKNLGHRLSLRTLNGFCNPKSGAVFPSSVPQLFIDKKLQL